MTFLKPVLIICLILLRLLYFKIILDFPFRSLLKLRDCQILYWVYKYFTTQVVLNRDICTNYLCREWRISHVLSHHIYTNTVLDLEMTLLHPFIHWYPTDDKPFHVRFFPYLTLVTYPFMVPVQMLIRYVILRIVGISFVYDS